MYDAQRGWGFLRADEGFDAFVHASVVEAAGIGPLAPGESSNSSNLSAVRKRPRSRSPTNNTEKANVSF